MEKERVRVRVKVEAFNWPTGPLLTRFMYLCLSRRTEEDDRYLVTREGTRLQHIGPISPVNIYERSMKPRLNTREGDLVNRFLTTNRDTEEKLMFV